MASSYSSSGEQGTSRREHATCASCRGRLVNGTYKLLGKIILTQWVYYLTENICVINNDKLEMSKRII